MVQVIEEELILKIRSKKENAFEYLYDAYAPAFLGFIKRKITCSTSSEALLQNIFIKICSNIETFDAAKGRLFIWMLQITRHEIENYLRLKHLSYNAMTLNGLVEKTQCSFSNDKVINRFDLLKQIQHLPPKDRVILELNSRGFNCIEIGRLLKLPEGAIKSKMLKAYKQLNGLRKSGNENVMALDTKSVQLNYS